LACETSTATFTRDSTNVTSIVISADVDLNFHLVEANSFELSTSFYGRDSASVVCSESFDEDLLTWRLNVGASTLTDPPRESSQNSQIFFSSAQHNIALFCIPAIALFQTVIGQCTETASVTLSVSASWSFTDESRSQVTVSYLGPKAYGYDLSLTIPGETVSDWSADDETLLIANLMSFYNDPILSFTLLSLTDVNGNLVIVVNVLGFSTMSSVTFSYDLILGGGLVLSDSAFSSVTSTASTPGLSCSMGFSTTSSSDVCSDTDACLTDSCSDDGDLTAVCWMRLLPKLVGPATALLDGKKTMEHVAVCLALIPRRPATYSPPVLRSLNRPLPFRARLATQEPPPISSAKRMVRGPLAQAAPP